MTATANTVETRIILASGSTTRARMLAGAGIRFEVEPAELDESAIKRKFGSVGADAEIIAASLAEQKAAVIADRTTGRLVIGADQVLDCDGVLFDKPVDRTDASRQLETLRGREHALISAVCVMAGGRPVWSAIDRARLWMRYLSNDFIDWYLDAVGEAAYAGPGAYRVEGLGAQLFERIEGDHFTILGLPLLPLLEFLRDRRVLSS